VIDLENAEFELAKQAIYATYFYNRDTRRQLSTRCQYVIMKHHCKWSANQRIRVEILFEEYPEIEKHIRHR